MKAFNRKTLERYRDFAENGRIVVFDTETTGLRSTDQIVQISAAEYIRGVLGRTMNVYVRPTCDMSPGAEAVHGLSLEFLSANGIPPCEAIPEFYDFIGSDVLVVAHNYPFDLSMVRRECALVGYKPNHSGVVRCDTLKLSRQLIPGLAHYRLGVLVEALHLDGQNSHDALDDALACGALFFDLVKRIPMSPEDYSYEYDFSN